MNKKSIFSIIRTGLLGAAMAVALVACEDDHFTANDGGGADANATLSLWEQLKADPELSRFRDIAEKTPYFKDEGHVVKGYTFADVLNGTQNLTVFAPTNQALTEEVYKEYLTMLQGSTSDQYDVFLRLIGNHITRNRYSATGTGEEDLVMVNGKRAVFDMSAKTFRGIQLAKANIGATNGTLHTINTVSPFAYNIYEYIKANPGRFSHLRDWLVAHDTLYFDSYRSAEGGSDANGNPIYVDSIYSRENTLFGMFYQKNGEEWIMSLKGLSGNIEREDSVWAMVLPTDQAWEEAWNQMKDAYDYAEIYPDKEREDQGTKDQTFGGNPDSLRNMSLSMDLAAPLLFNARLQVETPQHQGFWTAEQFKNTPMNKLFNARIDTFTVDKNATSDVKAILMGNAEPVEVSNGLVYPVDKWSFWEPYRTKDVEVKLNSRLIFGASTNNKGAAIFSNFNNTGALVTDSLRGTVSRDESTTLTGFMAIYGLSTGAPEVYFKLLDLERRNQVLSNVPYDIYVVMVPSFYYEQAQYDSITITQLKDSCSLQIEYNDGSVNSRGVVTPKKSTAMRWGYDNQKVDTICISKIDYPEGFIFPKSYKNIDRSYPVITLKSAASSANVKAGGGYQHTFYMDRIIFRARK